MSKYAFWSNLLHCVVEFSSFIIFLSVILIHGLSEKERRLGGGVLYPYLRLFLLKELLILFHVMTKNHLCSIRYLIQNFHTQPSKVELVSAYLAYFLSSAYVHCVAYICAVWPVYEVKCLCSRGQEWGSEGSYSH